MPSHVFSRFHRDDPTALAQVKISAILAVQVWWIKKQYYKSGLKKIIHSNCFTTFRAYKITCWFVKISNAPSPSSARAAALRRN
jgi:hypothetical protein